MSDESFQEAFSAAQNQTLLAVGSQPGTSEVVNASSGNTNGNFYVRVQGHGNQDFDAAHAFTLTATASGSGCGTLDPKTGETLMPPIADDAPSDPATVIVTDRLKTNYALDEEQNEIGSPELFIDELEKLADATHGVVVDLADSDRVQALWEQADAQNDCPYAVNLVAAAIDEIIANFRNGNSSYVVLAGGDDVVPFFRYPDVSGLGPESQFSPPMREGTAADGSLERDQVLSQDAYGSDTDVTIAGTTLPVPDLAVGPPGQDRPGDLLADRELPGPDQPDAAGAHVLAGHRLRLPDRRRERGQRRVPRRRWARKLPPTRRTR